MSEQSKRPAGATKRGPGGTRNLILGAVVLAGLAGAGLATFWLAPGLVGDAEAGTAIEAGGRDAAAATALPPAGFTGAPARAEDARIEVAQVGGTTTTTTTTHGGWVVVCNETGAPPSRVCSANFRVVNQQTNSNILVWLVGFNAEGSLLSEFLTLTDVLIQPGVVVTIDQGQAARAEFVECSTTGCKARLAMTPELVLRMKAAQRATIEITRLDGQIVQFQMEIPGVDGALAALGV